MCLLKFLEKLKTSQVHALASADTSVDYRSKPSKARLSTSDAIAHSVLPQGLLKPELLEPLIEPYLKPINIVDSLADLYRRLSNCADADRLLICIEKYFVLLSLGDDKSLRRSLCAARQYATDEHSKVVLSAWLRFEGNDDDGLGGGDNIPPSSVPSSASAKPYDHTELSSSLRCVSEHCDPEDYDVSFCINGESVRCVRLKIASLSAPLESMLYGGFSESVRDVIDFSGNGISLEGMQAVEMYSRSKRVDLFSSSVVLEMLVFANRFCCEEMKSACDAYLSSSICGMEDALLLIPHGLDENAHRLVASCLRVFLRELPKSLHNEEVMKLLCNSITGDRLTMLGSAAFLLYYFLCKVAMEEMFTSNTTVILLQRLQSFARKKWQKAVAWHLLGCVLLERKEYKEAQFFFEAAAQAGHVYSIAGVARTKFKQGQRYSAFRLINSLIFEYKPLGWMYQERSLYGTQQERLADLITATELDPTLPFPYKCRAVMMAEAKRLGEAIAEIDKFIRFKVSADLLELRAWFYIAMNDYQSALRDARALLAIDSNHVMSHGKLSIADFVSFLSSQVPLRSLADCWMQLYDRWSSVDDIGSLAVIHGMLATNPGSSVLHFRQSLLLLRLCCQKAAMRCLQQARDKSSAKHERLVYEGWISYNTGHREKALAKAEQSISLCRSFEAFFLKAYALTDSSLGPPSSSSVIQLLEEALTCPSDGLRKGQALNNLGSIYLDCNRLDQAANCLTNALTIRHTRAHQGLARLYHSRNQTKAAYDEMCKLIDTAQFNAAAYEKRSEYCDPDTAMDDLRMATTFDP